MSQIQSRVGHWDFRWKTVPRGAEGVAKVEIRLGNQVQELIEVRWKRDLNGIWISLPKGLVGFDLNGRKDDEGPMEYEVSQRGGPLEWNQVFLSYGGEEAQAAVRPQSKAIRVRAQMPGKIIRILTAEGQIVQKGQSIVVMEAMKMENEIRAPQAGKVTLLKVTEGQTVETGADLVLIEGGVTA